MTRYAISLEDIGIIDPGLASYCVIWKVFTGESVNKSRAWCAEIVGLNNKYKFDRKFMRPTIDYSQANSKFSRGVYKHYWLENGKLYEISSPQSWKHTDRYFATVCDGDLIKMDEEGALEWLKDR